MKFSHLLLPILALLVTSCEVEFSPNAAWKETPVVYCVLDQDDDTSWVRVEKCFLGEGSIYSYGHIADSVNYPQGALRVTLVAQRDGQAVDSMDFTYTLRQRDTGLFAGSLQPAYFCVTKGRLKEDCRYVLNIRRTSDGALIASNSSSPLALIRQTNEVLIRKPSNTGKFGFYDDGPNLEIVWNALENARRYQPRVRFYYEEYGDTHFVDLLCGNRTVTGNAQTYSLLYPRNQFLVDLRNALQHDTASKRYVRTADIYLTACDEQLNAYMNMATQTTSIEDGRQQYSNVDGGLGIVAARRTHLYKTVPVDSSDKANAGLHFFLKELSIGFE